MQRQAAAAVQQAAAVGPVEVAVTRTLRGQQAAVEQAQQAAGEQHRPRTLKHNSIEAK